MVRVHVQAVKRLSENLINQYVELSIKSNNSNTGCLLALYTSYSFSCVIARMTDCETWLEVKTRFETRCEG